MSQGAFHHGPWSFPHDEQSWWWGGGGVNIPLHLHICCTWCLTCFCFMTTQTICAQGQVGVFYEQAKKPELIDLMDLKCIILNDVSGKYTRCSMKVRDALQAARSSLRILGLLMNTSMQGFCVLPYSPDWIYFQQPWHDTQCACNHTQRMTQKDDRWGRVEVFPCPSALSAGRLPQAELEINSTPKTFAHSHTQMYTNRYACGDVCTLNYV